MKIIVITTLLCLHSISWANQQTEAIGIYNRLHSAQELVEFVFAADKKTTSNDLRFLKELKYITGTPLKAEIKENTILLGSYKIEILNAAQGLYSINGQKLTFSPRKPLEQTFKEIQSALDRQQSRYEFLIINRAHAVGPVAVAALSVYGIGAIITGSGCALWNYSFKKSQTSECVQTALAWPYAVWRLHDAIKSGNDIEDGSCENNGLVRLRLKNQVESGEKNEFYFKADAKTDVIKIFVKGYNSKTKKFEGLYEQDPDINSMYVGDDKKRASQFIDQLQKACSTGGTKALNDLIKNDSTVKKGLSKLVQDSRKKSDSDKKTAPQSVAPSSRQ